jgi:hypothetical protein
LPFALLLRQATSGRRGCVGNFTKPSCRYTHQPIARSFVRKVFFEKSRRCGSYRGAPGIKAQVPPPYQAHHIEPAGRVRRMRAPHRWGTGYRGGWVVLTHREARPGGAMGYLLLSRAPRALIASVYCVRACIPRWPVMSNSPRMGYNQPILL